MKQNHAAYNRGERDKKGPVVRLEVICKSFGLIKANSDSTLNILPTRVKALLGENGAGKSTTAKTEALGLMPAGVYPGEKLDNKEAET